MTKRRTAAPSGGERAEIASRYRRARVYLVLAVALLGGTAIYLDVYEWRNTWNAATSVAENLALGLQTAETAALQPYVLSLQQLSARIGIAPLHGAPDSYAALRPVAGADTGSAYLGMRLRSGGIAVVDQDGAPTPARLESALAALIPPAAPAAIAFGAPLQLPGDSTWYVPIALGTDPVATGAKAVFALVRVRSLLAGTDSLRVIPDSWITLYTPEGIRIFSYQPSHDFFELGDPPLQGELLARLTHGASGRLVGTDPTDQIRYVTGYSRSPLPLYVASGIPVSSVRRAWLAKSLAPTIVLVLGLLAIVIFALQLRRALLKQQSYLEHQEYLADHDSLTGLLNRDAFMRLLELEIAQHAGSEFAVLLLDLNRFKDINDTLGHSTGDRVLREIGQRLHQTLADQDAHVARLGGDELVVLVRNGARPGAIEQLGERLQACFQPSMLLEGLSLDLSASMGAALYPQDARTATELMRCADIAMYAAKRELRAFCRYVPLMDSFTPESLALKSAFARALREGELSLVYQPKVQLQDGSLAGLEALARWEHPELGSVAPARFVPLAESTELIHEFTQFVLESAIRQVARWRAAGTAVPVAVNISANNLLDQGFVDRIARLLQDAGVPAHLLELEITESAVMRQPETMLKRLQAIRELGVRLAIDDFGTGYTALAYLKRLPVHALKIDKTFIVNLDGDQADQRIVLSAIQLAHGFGMSVVAEGVETAEVAERLRDYRCDQAQGFHFAQPMTAAEVSAHWVGTLRTRRIGVGLLASVPKG